VQSASKPFTLGEQEKKIEGLEKGRNSPWLASDSSPAGDGGALWTNDSSPAGDGGALWTLVAAAAS